jgi:hypothetical protein
VSVASTKPGDGVAGVGEFLFWLVIGILIVLLLLPTRRGAVVLVEAVARPQALGVFALIAVLILGFFVITQPERVAGWIKELFGADTAATAPAASTTSVSQPPESAPEVSRDRPELWHATVHNSKDTLGNDTGVYTYRGPGGVADDRVKVNLLKYGAPLGVVCKTVGRRHQDPSFGDESIEWYRLEDESYINGVYVKPQDESSPPKC